MKGLPIFKLLTSIFALAITHFLLTELVIQKWSYLQVSTLRFLFAFIFSLFIFKKKMCKEAFVLSILFGGSSFILFQPFLKNSAQATTVLYTFPLHILILKVALKRIKVSLSILFIFIQTFLGVVVINRMSFSLIVIDELILAFISSLLMASYYLYLEKRKLREDVLPSFFLIILLWCLGSLITREGNIILDIINPADTLIIAVSAIIGTVWVFKVFHESVHLMGAETVGIFYYYLPFFHFFIFNFAIEEQEILIADYLGAVVLFFGPILYIVSINENKRVMLPSIKLD